MPSKAEEMTSRCMFDIYIFIHQITAASKEYINIKIYTIQKRKQKLTICNIDYYHNIGLSIVTEKHSKLWQPHQGKSTQFTK